ncbi:hypothetical protein LXA47_01975 [Massilia sp. P8910]|uniref:hypothetical protein n=1 Tax=Massilia antarctica TaxID=2765360 RepID=UPI001E651EEA|nr:hypothetical protein [Massilia antarctica]MCE3602381.1 hypothetical protein [Massilia antarctica]
MSIQTYDFVVGTNKSVEISAQGRYVYYQAGSTPLIDAGSASASAGNQGIKCTAGGTGTSVVLMPGQSLRLPASEKAPGYWRIDNAKNLEQVYGKLLVGEGEFTDANILNTVRLDGSVVNLMKVSNSTAERVPVKLDPNDIYMMGPIVQYTDSLLNPNVMPIGATTIVSPAANVNGVILSKVTLASDASATYSLLTKASAPTNVYDGNVLYYIAPGAPVLDNVQAIKIPAGRGLYFFASANCAGAMRNLLWAVL